MSRTEYYEAMKARAREVRAQFGLTSYCVQRSDMRRIYAALGIRIVKWPHKLRKLRGAYFNDDLGPEVMIDASLPVDPAIFTLAHELKHHLCDGNCGAPVLCEKGEQSEVIEIGAEIFAAELIFPESEFSALVQAKGGECTSRLLVEIKHETKTTLSYAGMAKRAVFLGFAPNDGFKGVQWKKLEESIYGEPLHRRLIRTGRIIPKRKTVIHVAGGPFSTPGAA